MKPYLGPFEEVGDRIQETRSPPPATFHCWPNECVCFPEPRSEQTLAFTLNLLKLIPECVLLLVCVALYGDFAISSRSLWVTSQGRTWSLIYMTKMLTRMTSWEGKSGAKWKIVQARNTLTSIPLSCPSTPKYSPWHGRREESTPLPSYRRLQSHGHRIYTGEP